VTAGGVGGGGGAGGSTSTDDDATADGQSMGGSGGTGDDTSATDDATDVTDDMGEMDTMDMDGMGGMGGMSGGDDTMDMSGGDGAAADPSPGCGNANPDLGSSQGPLNVANHQYYVKIPADYDPMNPYIVIFMFHPTNNPLDWAEQNAGFERNGAADGAIRVYPGAGNNASGWGANDVDFFEPLYDTIMDNFCVDRARVFAAGESSGGDFASILGCEFADKIRAIGPCATKPVGGYPLDAGQRSCTGQVGAVVIHGLNDMVVGPENGPATRDFYVALNHCTSMSTPVDGYTDPMSNCVQYEGCDDGYPVIWCGHTDPEYSNTNHGWPKFAGDFLWEHFSSY
jgi:poly(3-hydroxybutyrate) depolymerase